MEKFNRAVRRHHIERLKAKRKGYWGYPHHYGIWAPEQMDARQLGKVAQYPQPCSCRGCGNQRKWEGPKFAELLQVDDLRRETRYFDMGT